MARTCSGGAWPGSTEYAPPSWAMPTSLQARPAVVNTTAIANRSYFTVPSRGLNYLCKGVEHLTPVVAALAEAEQSSPEEMEARYGGDDPDDVQQESEAAVAQCEPMDVSTMPQPDMGALAAVKDLFHRLNQSIDDFQARCAGTPGFEKTMQELVAARDSAEADCAQLTSGNTTGKCED